MFTRLRALIPDRKQLLANRWLAPLRPFLDHPKLWHWSRRGVAQGVAIGLFFGLLIPFAQIPISAAAAVALRANLPAAVASTLITNPLTFAPLYFGAYHLGMLLTGVTTAPADAMPDASFLERIQALGMPLIVGLGSMAIIVGVVSYLVITLAWQLHVRRKRRQQQAARTGR